MDQIPKETAKERIIRQAIELFRRTGFLATTVDQVCAAAGVSKGAFFHHFGSKEELAEACLSRWCSMLQEMEQEAPFCRHPDPLEKLKGAMEFHIGVFESPDVIKSCLAGTTVQEVSETHPRLREASNACFTAGRIRFAALIDGAAAACGKPVDSSSMAALWLATMQGALLLYKASNDSMVIRSTLSQVRDYIICQLSASDASKHVGEVSSSPDSEDSK
ncbi:MAG: TetR/AcrR family transcriptional regulator [Phycisphaerae bacterium]|nr:TetR/AcrR family transcriptional regulator [Phycisphaerae bacterium]